MGYFLLKALAFSFSLFSHSQDLVIPLKITNSIYGAGSFKAPCRAQNMSGECKIDTGINVSSFRADAFTILPTSLGTATYTSVSGSKIHCDFVSLPSVQLGTDVEIGKLEPVVCQTLDNAAQENLLGIDAFLNRSFTLSPKKQTLTLLESNPVLQNKMRGQPDAQILMDVKSGFKKPLDAIAMFDSGASLSTVDIKLVEAQPENYTIINTNSIGTDSHGNPLKSYLVLGSVQVGEVKLIAEYFMAIDFTAFQESTGENIQIILGFNAIQDHEWTFNMVDRTWSVE